MRPGCRLGESGGIGRRAGLRIQWGNPWEFESPLSHHIFTRRGGLRSSARTVMNAATSKSLDVSVEAMPGLERRITVRVPSADIEREVAARLAKVGKTAKLKGFRPGKVPPKIVRQYYGGQVRDEVLSDVIRA